MNLRSALLAGVVTVPLALAGCSQGGAPSSASPGTPPASGTQSAPERSAPAGDSVAWANEFCGLVGGFTAAQKQAPPVDKSSPEAFKASSIKQLESTSQDARDTLGGLRGMKPAPIPGAEGVVNTFERGFVRALDVLNSAKAKAEKVDTSDKRAFTSGMVAVQQEVKKGQGINFSAGFSKLNNSGKLNSAASKAPTCQALMKPAKPEPQQPQQPHQPQR
ncbi:hypothetical protein FHX42_003930 [Saccharopolyspora lacisalsi]|uniref:Small secreted protein n=1 Tax=Halosaccharopolyspora lacisalsi TaxID=1000566 RepID=A0A839E5E7_9PSEU|nr:hypothetical protein [Halosaccharopolyspora lacisalsi]MBA8826551.1 hypothetical protein [Halosaccharopolyspora lacisalsi]